MKIAKKKLKSESVTEHLTKPAEKVPHFAIDVTINGIQFSKGSKLPIGTSILVRLYSIQKSATSTEQPIWFARPQPFITDLRHATKRNNLSFINSLMAELQKVYLQNEDDTYTAV